jgi:hypothetical protein
LIISHYNLDLKETVMAVRYVVDLLRIDAL